MGETAAATGPDFSEGVRLAELPLHGTLAGRVKDEPVLLTRVNDELFAVGGACTHYGAHLAAGLVTGETVRCPWHHACFSLRTGAALRSPAFDPLPRWRVEREGALVFVREKETAPAPAGTMALPADISSMVIVGGGAAGFASADALRRLGYGGRLTMISSDRDPPCDRPNLSKDYLAGTAQEEWVPLRDDGYYRDRAIDLRLDTEIVAIDAQERTAVARSGEAFPFDRLLIATGSEPISLRAPGFDRPNVHTLRSLADARHIIERAEAGARAAIIGSSFIGLEAAAALRTRGVEVAVISHAEIPFERIFGSEVGRFLQRLHERNGVRFHLGRTASEFDGHVLTLDKGEKVEADFVLVGVGVGPRTALAASLDLTAEDGIPVDEYLETSVSGIFAAGDVANYPDPRSGRRGRIEHWVTALEQGRIAAANMLGLRKPFSHVPFFWSEQYGTALRYVGRAPRWDEVRIDGDMDAGAFTARYFENGELRASASVGRDRENLEDELFLECGPESAENKSCRGNQ
ncbi:FAD-dependent oxidoreductase [Sphingosinicella humi]|uniref:Pyridine nucleotide-disulfide oxidoreductase n=1 Tax=Allosphingosinicella humi TaxID=2068657 RepID=A0A2U2J3Y3_9SPHN|nr:FAD-dependent oxidoreductase [Sphingosinicella humi]PWG03056.1 pyridine nucleotide-disulfide oxidoreductase [Sphingosinicella humi]